MEETVLNAEPRQTTGKAVKNLRRSGYVPAVVYGHRTAPMSLQVPERTLRQALRASGGNRLIALQIPGQEPKHVLAREVQRDALSHVVLHIDFYEVIMTEKIRTQVPVVLIGEALPVKKGEGLLLKGLDAIEVECLPGDLPPRIEVSLATLTAIDQTILVRDIKLDAAVKILTEPEEFLAKIIPPEKEEVEEVTPVAAAPEVELVGKKKVEGEAEGAAAPQAGAQAAPRGGVPAKPDEK